MKRSYLRHTPKDYRNKNEFNHVMIESSKHFFLDIIKFVYNIPKLLQTIASLYPNKYCQRDDKFKQIYTMLI